MNGGGGEVGGLGREVGGVGREWDLPSSIEDGLSLTPIPGVPVWTLDTETAAHNAPSRTHTASTHINLYLTSNDFCLSMLTYSPF